MRTGYMVVFGISIARVVVGVVPAAFAQDPRILDHGKSAGTAIEAEKRQAYQSLRSNTGISLAEPIGRVSVGPEYVDGAPIYVRRTTVREGMVIVEVSTTPFMPALRSNEAPGGARPDQPASW